MSGFARSITVVSLVLVGLFAATTMLARAWENARRGRAEAHFRAGQRLSAEGRSDAAVEEYRAALSYEHEETRYRMALATALMNAGHLAEAEAHFNELLEGDPSSAEINLMLARIAARQRRTRDAVNDYHRAIYGLWPANAEENRVRARFELVELLRKAGERKALIAELLELADDAPDDPETQTRIGSLLLENGSPAHAAEVLRTVLDEDPKNAPAAAGLARAYFIGGDYAAADKYFRRAARLAPGDESARRGLDETEEILRLDPTLPSLSSGQRYARSRELLLRVVSAVDRCAPPDQAAVTADAKALLAGRRREGDIPRAIDMAEHLWQTRASLCAAVPESDEPLALLMAKVAR